MKTVRILILDCTTKTEPSEGLLLKQFFQICKIHNSSKAEARLYRIKSKKDFLNKLDTGNRYDIIHISAHGTSKGSQEVCLGNGSSWKAYPKEIVKTNHRTKLILVNACVSNRKAMVDAFHGAKTFIAPSSEVEWIDAAMFSLAFYKRYILDGVRIHRAFLFARKNTKTGKDYPDYWER